MRGALIVALGFFVWIEAPVSAYAQQPAVSASELTSRAKTCRESFSANSTEEFNKKCVALAGPLAAMRGGALVLRMDDGSRKTFKNKESETSEAFGYGLADFYPSTHIFVVCDYGVDASLFKAVDGKTGRELDFGYVSPEFSPDGDWALTTEYDEDGITPSSFAIMDARGNKPTAVWTSKASKIHLPAKAHFVTWMDDKTIKLAGPDRKPVFLTQADDGSWGIAKTAR